MYPHAITAKANAHLRTKQMIETRFGQPCHGSKLRARWHDRLILRQAYQGRSNTRVNLCHAEWALQKRIEIEIPQTALGHYIFFAPTLSAS